MKVIDEIENITFDLSEVKADLEIYNTDYLKDKWADKACEEFVMKLQNAYGVIDEIKTELEQLKSYWTSYTDGELK